MIYTATMWVLPASQQGQGDRENWTRTVMRGSAVDEADFKAQCKALQGPQAVVEFGPVSVKAS
jgi:hypothetical protein